MEDEFSFLKALTGKRVEIRLMDEPLYRGDVLKVNGSFVTLTNVELHSTQSWVAKSGEHTFNFQYLLRMQILG